MAPPTMKLANRSNAYMSVSIVSDNRDNCKQCQPSLNGLVSTGVRPHILKTLSWISFIFGMMADIGLKFFQG